MTEPHRDLERQLERLTRWSEGEEVPGLWRTALDTAHAPTRTWLPSRAVLGIAAAVMLAVVGVWFGMGTLGSARVASERSPSLITQTPASMAAVADIAVQPLPPSPSAPPPPSQRAIQRSATIELRATDVRSVLESALALVDPALGEFVQSSSATEERGDAVLRVASDRLDAVMRMLRGLEGIDSVHREELSTTDATDRLVDLNARITNETRVEAELLALIDSRPDAPLADVLRVRDALSDVRLGIERLEAQRANLNQVVALATVRVSVERSGEREAPEASGFVHDLGVAFSRGGRDFARSITAFVEFIVGGMIVWVPLVVVGVWAYRTLRWRSTWA